MSFKILHAPFIDPSTMQIKQDLIKHSDLPALSLEDIVSSPYVSLPAHTILIRTPQSTATMPQSTHHMGWLSKEAKSVEKVNKFMHGSHLRRSKDTRFSMVSW